MKKLLYLVLFLPLFTTAQTEFATVQLPFDCEDYVIEGRKIAQLPDGNYFSLSQLTYNGSTFPFTLIQDQNGNTIQSQYYTDGFVPFSFEIHENSSTVYITGYAEDQSNPRLYLCNTNYDGTLNWEKEYEVVDAVRIVRPLIEISDDDHIYIHTWEVPTTRGGTTYDDMVMWDFDLVGNVTNTIRYCTSSSYCGGKDDQIYSMDILDDDNIILVGCAGTNPWEGMFHTIDPGLSSISFAKTDNSIQYRNVLAHSSGNIVTGGDDINSASNTELLMMDYSYNLLWNIEFTVDGYPLIIRDLLEGANQDIIVVGEIEDGSGNDNIVLIYFDSSGNLKSAKKHIYSTNTNFKFFDTVTGNTVIGFASVEYTRGSTSYNTIESFVANQYDNLCIFEDADVVTEKITTDISLNNIYDDIVQFTDADFNNETPVDLIEKQICFPCGEDDKSSAKAVISGGTATENAQNEMLELTGEESENVGVEALNKYISPNPATNQVNIDLTTSDDTEQQMVIYSLNGAKVMEQTVKGGSVSTLNLSLDSGVYLIQIDNVSYGKLVVQ
tara:strand:+ start:267 stop:1928 length:1662 start_codon:yes stop_codon:yes gene_type:complete